MYYDAVIVGDLRLRVAMGVYREDEYIDDDNGDISRYRSILGRWWE